MELWIRSQDKNELVKIEEVCIHIDEDGFIGIWSYGSNKNLKYYLGNYSTKERALEVLDEIQDMFLGGDFEPKEEDMILICGSARIYEMPEK